MTNLFSVCQLDARIGQRHSFSTRFTVFIVAAFCVLQLCSRKTVLSADWTHWRGPQRNGKTSETSGFTNGKWNLGKPAWKANVGSGCSSPIVADGKCYITGWKNNREVLTCLNLQNGQKLWLHSIPCPKYGRHSTGDKGIYAGPSSTPEFDESTGWIYTLGIDGDLLCRDTRARGKIIWKRNLYADYQVKQRPNVGRRKRMLRDYGYTSSPLIYQDLLLVEVGSSNGNVIAFDKRTGKERWTSRCKDPAGHSGSPVLMTVNGVPCAVILTVRNLVVFRLDKGHEGETIATHPWTTDFANNIATPAVSGNAVIVTSAYNQYAMCKLIITLKGATVAWRVNNPSGVCSPVIHRGHVYWAWRGVHCLDFKTGKEIWRGGNVGSAGSCILTGDDRLIVWANRGDLSLVETAPRSPKKFKELAKQPRILRRDAWPHVVLANGHLLCKDRDGNIVCFSLKK